MSYTFYQNPEYLNLYTLLLTLSMIGSTGRLDRRHTLHPRLAEEEPRDAGRHEAGAQAGHEGAPDHARKVRPALRAERGQNGELDADAARVGEAAEGVGGDGHGARGEQALREQEAEFP